MRWPVQTGGVWITDAPYGETECAIRHWRPQAVTTAEFVVFRKAPKNARPLEFLRRTVFCNSVRRSINEMRSETGGAQ